MNFFTPARCDASSKFLVPMTLIDQKDSFEPHTPAFAATWKTISTFLIRQPIHPYLGCINPSEPLHNPSQ